MFLIKKSVKLSVIFLSYGWSNVSNMLPPQSKVPRHITVRGTQTMLLYNSMLANTESKALDRDIFQFWIKCSLQSLIIEYKQKLSMKEVR